METQNPLPASRLYRACPPESLGFDSTEEVEPLTGVVGQPDAMAALEFGLAMTAPGYNLFVLGEPGSGRATLVRQAVRARAAQRPTPPDRCFVFNFRDPRHPRTLALDPGRAPEFARDVRALVAELRSTIPDALASDAVVKRRAALLEEPQRLAAEALDELRQEFERDEHVALVGAPNAIVVVPARGGEPLDRAAYLRLPPEEREQTDEHVRAANTHVAAVQRRINELMREARERIEELNRDVARSMVGYRVAALKEKYGEGTPVAAYFDALGEDVVEHADQFTTRPEEQEQAPAEAAAALFGLARAEFFRRYEVNVLVTRSPGTGAPVVEEPDPHLGNLLGHLGLHVRFGTMVADFSRISPGALQRANGGYLVLNAADVLTRPLAWPALKRALRTGELRPAEATAELGLVVADSLEPEPIPAELKVVLIGQPALYYLLRALDPEFGELFKIKVDFRPNMERTPETEHSYAQLVAARTRAESLPAFDATAVAALVEEGSRVAGDQRKLTTRCGEIVDLVRQSAHWAQAAGRRRVRAEDVERAIAERERRDLRLRRELLELIERGVLAFEPTGERVGQIYGIGLISAAGELFGRPIRVMASAYMGTGGVINIEREAKLAGPLHSKGFLVLSGYLGWMFARTEPLILSASLSFEQMYEEVEGDSASVAELYALMSAIGEVPVRQGIAVTGAINEKGLVLPVGGVADKVEGFFAACERTGLTGEQGVILPRRNVDNLVVRRGVREAVDAGRFRLWAIDRIEEGWTILTGREAGERRPDGSFPEGTVHRAVQDRLSAWAREWKRLARLEVRP